MNRCPAFTYVLTACAQLCITQSEVVTVSYCVMLSADDQQPVPEL
jgi:hypothetical protein